MTKESCNRIGLRFQSGERFFDRQSKVKLVGDGVFGDISLDVLPDLLVGVELGRVRRQVDEFEAALGGLDVGLDGLGLVDAVAVHDQDDGLLGLQHELLQETLKHLGVDQPFMDHELHGAVQTNGRDHLDRGPRAGAAHDGRLAHGAPGGAAVVVAAHASLVGKEHTSAIAPGTRHQFGQNLCAPIGDEHCVLLPCSVQGALRAEAQGVHHLADRGNAELDLELSLDELCDEAQRPQAEVERELVGAMLAHQKGQAAQLLSVELGRAARDLLGHQSILATVDEGRHPLQHRAWRDFENLRNVCRRHSLTIHLYRLHSNPFLFLTAGGENRSGVKFCAHSGILPELA